MRRLRTWCTGRRPVHFFREIGVAASLTIGVAGFVTAVPAAAEGATMATAPSAAQSLADFYKARRGIPLWFSSASGDAPQQLITLLTNANVDGIAPGTYDVAGLQRAVEAARAGKRKDVDRADQMLSAAFADYVRQLHQDPGVGVTYVDPSLRPTPPSIMVALLQAANASSLSDYVSSLGWMHPFYGQLRQAIVQHQYSNDNQLASLQLNLKRARALPAFKDRYVLVNAAQQRLYMYENGKPVDSMVTVVGKPKWPTPMLTAYIRYAALNPYWYVPPDLAGEDVGQFVVKQGLKYLDDYGYEVVSSWDSNPTIIDPSTVDWKGVVDGKVDVMIRQKPGPKNFMGRMKFMFPNQFGVYLHDNPRRDLFLKSVRYFSGGCVRLEDAPRLGRWLFGRDLDWQSAGAEQPVNLAQPVPVFITYMTAMPDGQAIAYYDDAYGRDKVQLAGSTRATAASR